MIQKIIHIVFTIAISTSLINAQTVYTASTTPLGLTNSGGGTSWDANSDSVQTSDGNSSTIFIDYFADSTVATLRCLLYTFSIPDSADIIGLSLRVNRKADSLGTTSKLVDVSVRVGINSSPMGDNKASPSAWPSSFTWQTYGDTTDTWGINWTPSDFNGGMFETYIQANFSDSDPKDSIIGLIDHIVLDVYYTIDTSSVPPNIGSSYIEEELNYLYPLQTGFSNHQIQEQGTAKIYNKEGRVVNELVTPSYWAGTDQNGQLLPMGIYYIIVNEEKLYPVMLVK